VSDAERVLLLRTSKPAFVGYWPNIVPIVSINGVRRASEWGVVEFDVPSGVPLDVSVVMAGNLSEFGGARYVIPPDENEPYLDYLAPANQLFGGSLALPDEAVVRGRWFQVLTLVVLGPVLVLALIGVVTAAAIHSLG
jgi:hypothetical protein